MSSIETVLILICSGFRTAPSFSHLIDSSARLRRVMISLFSFAKPRRYATWFSESP